MHSTRRSFVVGLLAGTGGARVLPGVIALLGACSRAPESAGPVTVHWDRETCANCRMVISERRFAAQLQGGPGMLSYKFDDVGCAINWLERQPWGGDPTVRMWVPDPTTTAPSRWADAARSHFQRRHGSPMGYDYAPVSAADPAGVSFVVMRGEVLADGRRRSPARMHGSGGRS